MTEVIIFATGLFAIINPLALLPLYQDAVSVYPAEVRRRMVVRTTLATGIFLLIIVWFGAAILTGLQIEIGSMQIAGGVIMFRAALAMLEPEDKQLKKDEQEQLESAAWSAQAVVPLAIPFTVGGGTMAYVIASTVGLDQSGLVIMSLVCVFTAALVGLMYQFGRHLLEALGPIGTRIIVRISGIILIAMSIQLVAGGARRLFLPV